MFCRRDLIVTYLLYFVLHMHDHMLEQQLKQVKLT